jgi:predicted nucleotidyltransferase
MEIAHAALAEDEQLLLLGVTGSTAYGLATEQSDVDRLGIYCVPSVRLFGLDFNQGKASIVVTDPDDVQLHEIGKYVGLVLKGNPTVTELLYLDEHEVRDPRIEPLIEIRSKLIGQRTVRAAYTGYAVAQAKRLANRQAEGRAGFNSDLAKRTAKHGRHCFRLMLQAEQLLTEGTITVDVSEHRDELFAVGELAEHDVDAFLARFEARKNELDALTSSLPEEPDRDAAEAFLREFRISLL